ncbi:hypothetical protein A2753_02010 [Candidatus Uhrbacteria bacterium RIFCSPHIGHO2_01_FULL_47_11]|nr:MAG: hypothetical protein A2753_02010 [Candidatus Uhrbacteria bacterium RIFCSPHIGHO2_01_FULL_47_11]
MTDTLLLNGKEYHLTKDGLPCLITYKEKTGGSHFSVTLAADLFLQGAKILFLSAYPMARDNFFEQVKKYESQIASITSVKELNAHKDARVIIPESGNERLFIEILHTPPDLRELVVLVKNMEVFSPALLNECLKLKNVIFSGNLDACAVKQEIARTKFNTTIIFTKPETPLPFEPLPLEKYTGYIWSGDKQGIIKVQMEGSEKTK